MIEVVKYGLDEGLAILVKPERMVGVMFTMKCPACGAESKLSFVDDSYEGPRRCWKCHGAFELKVVDNKLEYCEPITEEEFKQMQEANALRNKMKGR